MRRRETPGVRPHVPDGSPPVIDFGRGPPQGEGPPEWYETFVGPQPEPAGPPWQEQDDVPALLYLSKGLDLLPRGLADLVAVLYARRSDLLPQALTYARKEGAAVPYYLLTPPAYAHFMCQVLRIERDAVNGDAAAAVMLDEMVEPWAKVVQYVNDAWFELGFNAWKSYLRPDGGPPPLPEVPDAGL
jgi:hypothetical protein